MATRRHRHRVRCDFAGAIVRTAGRVWSSHRRQRGCLTNGRDQRHCLGLGRRAGFVACDYAAALSDTFDLIVSNPPYIRSAEISQLATEVRDHDPHQALDGGTDGLDAYRALIPQAARLLAPGGALVVEVGRGQSADVQDLMMSAGLTIKGACQSRPGGIHRAVAA